jgi:protein SCO1/2
VKTTILRWSLYVLSFVTPMFVVAATEGGLGAATPAPEPALAKPMGPDYFPNVVLQTHEGKEVRFYDDLIKGKTVVINFMYARCEGQCPGTTANLRKVQKLLGDSVGRDVHMYSLSLKPEQDSPEDLATYAAAHGVGPGWLFLTGKPEDLELLRQKLGFTDPNPDVDQDKSSHIGMVLYGNETKQQWAACPCLSDPKVMVEQISWMLQEDRRPAQPPREQPAPAHGPAHAPGHAPAPEALTRRLAP